MNRSKKIFGSVFIALLIACLLLSVVGIGYYTDGFTNFVKDSAAPVDVNSAKNENSLNTGFEIVNGDSNSEFIPGGIISEIRLAAQSEGVVMADNFLYKDIDVVVYPETLEDRTFNVIVEWGETSYSDDVNNYVQVDLIESDSVRVRCIKAFIDSTINVFFQSNANPNVFAVLTCSYSPSFLKLGIDPVGFNLSHNDNIGDYYELIVGNTYNFNLKPLDFFGNPISVDISTTIFSTETAVVGSVVVQDYVENINTGVGNYTGESKEVSIDSYDGRADVNPYNSEFYTGSSTANPTLFFLEALASPTDIYTSTSRKGTILTYHGRFKSFVDDGWYFNFVIDTTSVDGKKVSASFKARILNVEDTSSVSLSSSNINF